MPDEGSVTAPRDATVPGSVDDDTGAAGTEPAAAAGLPADGDGVEGLGEQTVEEVLPSRGPLRTAFRALGLVEQGVGAALIVVILVLVLAQVALRYLPGAGLPWTGEVARFAMVWVAFVLSGYLLATDGHIAIKVVDYVLPPRPLAVLQLAGHVLITVTSLVMIYATLDFMGQDRGQVTAAAGIPLAVIYAVPVLGFASTVLRGLLLIASQDVPRIAQRDEEART